MHSDEARDFYGQFTEGQILQVKFKGEIKQAILTTHRVFYADYRLRGGWKTQSYAVLADGTVIGVDFINMETKAALILGCSVCLKEEFIKDSVELATAYGLSDLKTAA